MADLVRSYPDWTLAIAGIAAVKLIVGGLLLSRHAVRRRGSWSAWLTAAPSLAIAYIAFRLAAPPDEWPWWSVAMFVAGVGVTILSLATLGRSFSVFPAVREIVAGGPYRLVRHPAYAGQLLLVAGCATSATSWWSYLPLLIGVPLVAARIHAEEQLLLETAEYAEYADSVRWRLIPGIW